MLFFTRLLLSFLLVALNLCVFAQVSFDSDEELEQAANTFFNQEEYTKAKPLFSQLLSKDALNPNYNYRFGVCVMYTEADPLKPLPYIEGGATSAGVNKEAHYFLGKAYQYNYRFEDAQKAFKKAKDAGYSKPGVDLNRNIEECLNGKVLYNPSIDFKPAQNKEVLASEFYRPYDFRKLKGKVIPMPPSFKTKYDEKNLLGTVVYTPSNSNILVYASYGEDGVNAKDLYMVNRLPNGEWALPQRLSDIINTKYDEDFAFYDMGSNTLLFASKGHNSMGGYDVFSSNYNADENTWSTPTNLQYPVNSPFDDFLYVSDPNGKVAFFTTARNTVEGKLRVMKALLYNEEQVELSVVEGMFVDQTDSVYNYASVTVLDPITNQVIGKYRTNRQTGKYVLILPPQNGYTMDVGPREANGFKFDLDVPKHEETETLQQGITYNASSDEGIVTVTNYFDAVGKPDSIELAASKPLKEVSDKMIAMPDPTPVLATKEARASENDIADATELAASANQEAELLVAKKIEEEKAVAAEAAAVATKAKAEQEEANRLAAEAERIEKEKATALQAKKLEEERLLAEMQKAEALALAKSEQEKIEQQAAEAKRLEEEKLAADKANQETEEAKLLAEMKAAEEALLAESEREEQEKLVVLAAENELEKAKQDSLAQVALAMEIEAEAAKAEIALAEEKAELESQKEEEIQRLAVIEAEKAAAAQQKQDEQDRLMAMQEAARIDSIAQTELAQIEDSERKKALEDSTLKANQEIALAEKARLNQINREVELAKQQALRDSAEQMVITEDELASKESESFDQLLKEMEEKEAELLREQELAVDNAAEKPRELESENKEIIEVDAQEVNPDEVEANQNLELAASPETPTVSADIDTTNKNEETSEADLFLATIAKLEEQKAEQQRLIDEENAQLAEQKANRVTANAAVTNTEAENTQSSSKVIPGSVADIDTTLVLEADEKMVDVEVEIAALESDANPQEYLDALNEIEKAIADEAASRPDKDYTLKPLPSAPTTSVDGVLQERIDADRLALEEHQKVAVEKEKTLREEMQRDKDVLEGADQALVDEIAAIENEVELLEGELAADSKTGSKLDLGKPAKAEEELESRGLASEEITEEIAPINSLVAVEVERESEIVEAVSEELLVAETNEELLEESTEEIADIVEETEVKVEDAEVAVETEVMPETSDPDLETEELLVAEADQEIEELLAETLTESSESDASTIAIQEAEVAVDSSEEEPSLTIEEPKQPVEPAKPVEPITLPEQSETQEVQIPELQIAVETKLSEEIAKPAERVVTVGTIPFLKAAIRNPEKTKPSFEEIEDKSQRRMIKRMRAEDIGRMAVLKNIKNQKIDAKGDSETVESIQANVRNKEVLANSTINAREEYIRPRFDKNHLKQREEVFYKLEFRMVSENVSETISETMTPEQAMTFAMPEIGLTSDLYFTFADANSGYKEYKDKGFKAIQVIPYLKGAPTTLSVVEEIPFID